MPYFVSPMHMSPLTYALHRDIEGMLVCYMTLLCVWQQSQEPTCEKDNITSPGTGSGEDGPRTCTQWRQRYHGQDLTGGCSVCDR